MAEFIDVCRDAAIEGGRVLTAMRGRISPREKAPKDLVTEADLASQEKIRQVLLGAFPEHQFVGEEVLDGVTTVPNSESPYCWIVDPLDGTLNYVHQLPNYSVSIALRHLDEIIAATVYDPVADECFTAVRGQGAMLNGVPVHTSQCTRVDQALIAASLPAEIPRQSPEVLRFIEVMHAAQAIRRLGSAALNLCYVAMGRLDAYWATCVKIWDIAAGQLLLQEAGGSLTRPDGTPFDLDRPQFAAAATPELQKEFLAVLARAVR